MPVLASQSLNKIHGGVHLSSSLAFGQISRNTISGEVFVDSGKVTNKSAVIRNRRSLDTGEEQLGNGARRGLQLGSSSSDGGLQGDGSSRPLL